MAVTVELHNTGDPIVQVEIRAIVEHVLSDRAGDWHVVIMGSQADDRWEMKIAGPNGFERSYPLEGAAGEHQPLVIGAIVARMVPASNV